MDQPRPRQGRLPRPGSRRAVTPPLVRNYAVALLGPLLALVLRQALVPLWGNQHVFLLFCPAIVLSAWCGGVWMGLLTTLVSGLAGDYFFVEPLHTLFPRTLGGWLQFTLYLLIGLGMSWLIESLQRARRHAEDVAQALRDSEEQLRMVTDSVPVSIAYCDTELRYLFVNQVYAERLGRRRDEILGQRLADVLGDAAVERLRPYLETVLRGQPVEFEIEVPYQEIGSHHMRVAYVPDFDPAGEVRGLVAAVTDVSDRKQNEERLRSSQLSLAGIIASAMDAIITVDEQQRVTVFNAAAERMFGYSAQEVLGQPIDRFIPERFRERHRGHIQTFGKTGDTGRSMGALGTLVALRAGGEEFPIEATISQVEAAGRKLFTVIMRDITHRQQMERELQQRADELAKADRAKDHFLAVLAHELRNPIGAISNAVELLKRRDTGDPRLSRPREIIERQVQQQGQMLDDLLNVSRVARGKITLHPISLDLTRLVRDVVEDHRSVLEGAGLTVTRELPPEPIWLTADPTRLAQVLSNLLVNAAKFTDAGGQVGVQVLRCSGVQVFGTALPEHLNTRTPQHLNADVAAISITDTGIGIEPELLPLVFESFSQGERSLHRSRGGLGLGLALVKGLVELHGGVVRAESAGPGQGATFTVVLPLGAPLGEPEGTDAPAAVPTGPLRILVIEDNEDAAAGLQELLEIAGCTVAVAHTGDAGIELARQFRPEVVLCDLGLPVTDGYAVATALRRDPALANIRLIAVSGYGQEEDRRRSRDAGFDLHLTKPIDFNELQRLLEVTPDTQAV